MYVRTKLNNYKEGEIAITNIALPRLKTKVLR